MKVVELQTAYHWYCPHCDAANYALPQKAEFTKEGREEAYRDFHGLEEWEELPEGWDQFEMVQIPHIVRCFACHEEFKTIDERQE